MGIKDSIAKKYIRTKFGDDADFSLFWGRFTIADATVSVIEMMASKDNMDILAFIENKWELVSSLFKIVSEEEEKRLAEIHNGAKFGLATESDYESFFNSSQNERSPVLIEDGVIVNDSQEERKPIQEKKDPIPGKTKTSLHPRGYPATNIERFPFLFYSGVFRCGRHASHQQLIDDTVVHTLPQPVSKKFNAFKMSGFALNAMLDLDVYLCLSYHLGRLSDKEYDDAIKNTVEMSFEDFFSPIDRNRWPNPEDSAIIIDSFSRLKNLVFVFYKNKFEAKRAKGADESLVANISGDLGYDRPNRKVTFKASDSFRQIYRTSEYYEFNRLTIAESQNQLSRVLIIWLSSRKKAFIDKEDGSINVIKESITIKDLLNDINPRVKYTGADVNALARVLIDLETNSLIGYKIDFKNKRIQGNKCLTLLSEFTLIWHRLANKNNRFEKTTRQSIELRSSKNKDSNLTSIAERFKNFKYARGSVATIEHYHEKWYAENISEINGICDAIKEIYDRDGASGARLALTGVHGSKLKTFQKNLEGNNHPFAKELGEICSQSLAKIKKEISKSDTDLLNSFMRKITLKKTRQPPEEWLTKNYDRIMDTKKIVEKIMKNGGSVSGANKNEYKARLIDPLHKTTEGHLAKYFQECYDKGLK
ncbi:hypothetical protein [Aeromonas veronii]|uniref:Uncharacterized protein n=1 Tax=Aeromonas veronii TaxID=654 RepID=A0A2T4N3X2_AERVE|nr:hypothetical protein [Aeromonas veronii]PTH81456.1 hypothetical protein DAA48_08705 [Aeromonas veronii]